MTICPFCGYGLGTHDNDCRLSKLNAGEERPRNIVDYSLHYRVNGFNIEMELQSKFNEATHSLSKWVVNTQDEAIRRALIALGWTPPKD